ncbi:MAG: NAD+ kinase [SAR86 cluster bacterium]|uniref:NAD kinase n=1 Tax=SAR86 cluster bacterium TaxID=2030880 RepID=A0A520MA60_9GAMM|nr:MAG: NAD+ kinase [SAR86 cluster bacterium]
MFKNIGIALKKDQENGDSLFLDSLLPILSKYSEDIYAEVGSSLKADIVKELDFEDFVNTVDLLIVFGGDGTLLSSARRFLDHETPILGINLGTVGFLTDVNIDNFESIIKDILSGEYETEDRSLVSATFLDKTLYGLNEIVIHSGSYAQLMRYRLTVDDKTVFEQRSDGLIVATPTGSTAYALSAGGPIIHPNLDVWTIIPMMPQSLSSRPFVISSNQKVEIKILSGPLEDAKICADGQDDVSAKYDTVVAISKMDKSLKLIHPKNNDFFEACREKLGWSLDITKNNSVS